MKAAWADLKKLRSNLKNIRQPRQTGQGRAQVVSYIWKNILLVGRKGKMEKKKRLKWKMEKRREDMEII